MARGRFVSKVISLDEEVDVLSDDTCRLLFTWLITHLDCEGRMHGDAVTVKSIVFPRRKDSAKKIEKYLQELHNSRLILRYSVGVNQYLCLPNFERHQPGLQKSKEAQSQIPAPTPELLQSYSRVTPPQVKVKEQDKDKVKEQDSSSSLSPEKGVSVNTDTFSAVYKTYKDSIGEITEQLKEAIDKAIEEYTEEWVIDAIKEAALREQPKWIYVKGILKNWKAYGRDGESNSH